MGAKPTNLAASLGAEPVHCPLCDAMLDWARDDLLLVLAEHFDVAHPHLVKQWTPGVFPPRRNYKCPCGQPAGIDLGGIAEHYRHVTTLRMVPTRRRMWAEGMALLVDHLTLAAMDVKDS